MTEGYFFIKHVENEYRLIHYEKGITQSVLILDFLNNCIDEHSKFNAWHFFRVSKIDIPFPTLFETTKNDYVEGDYAFLIHNSFLYYVKIKENYDNVYHLQSVSYYNTHYYRVESKYLIPYNYWELHKKCKSTMMELSKCLKRIGIYKDVRIYIAKWLWLTRNDYIWECNHKHSRRRSCHKKIKNYKC